MTNLSIIGSRNKKKRRDLVAELNKFYSKKKETKTKPTKQKTQNLENKLERPQINLTPLKKTAVHTTTQEEDNTLMQVYECGGWKWYDGEKLPTELNNWEGYKEETCIRAGFGPFNKKGEFHYCCREFYRIKGLNIISTNEFYNKQKITQGTLNEIKQYFENRK